MRLSAVAIAGLYQLFTITIPDIHFREFVKQAVVVVVIANTVIVVAGPANKMYMRLLL